MAGISIQLLGVAFFCLLSYTASQNFLDQNNDEQFLHCHNKGTCHDCLRASPFCSWCYRADYNRSRCDIVGVHTEHCSNDYENIPYARETFVDDRDLTDPVVFQEGDQIVQLKPQKITLKMRPGVKHPVKVEFRQAEDYPVDLYYLMDLSNSMSDDKDKLATLGSLLGIEMSKITKNFRLGFGSFVDKVVMPYVSMVPEKLKEPCSGCVPPYGFKNHLALTEKTLEFVKQVKSASVSGNLDGPEGGFDAIMQAVVCNDEIKWREKARRILLFSTDAGFHYAGDGKLGGIVTPNDGHCHMKNNEYQYSTVQDYPSLSQINSKIQEHKVNIIFAVTEDQEPIYSKLANMMEGCSHGKLNNDSSNVVDLVKEQYQKITSNIELTSDVPEKDEYFQVTFESSCLVSEGKMIETNKCGGIKVGDQVVFDVYIRLKKCPKSPSDWRRSIRISPVGISEHLDIDVIMECSCACEEGKGEPNSDRCSGKGTFKCGICSCNENHSGKFCECSDKENVKIGEETCRAEQDSRICSGRGECHCGQCMCHARDGKDEEVTGKFCECDNFSCDRHNGELCGGDSRGSCICGRCSCKLGWIGADCSCAVSNDRCNTTNGSCNGHGECHCGKCICDPDYTGDTCQECPTCPGKCDEFKDCVECQAFPENTEQKYSKEDCPRECDHRFITIKSPQLDYDEEKGDKLCIFRDAQDCKITFVYREVDIREANNKKRYTVRAKDKECAEPVNILAIILGVILGIVLIGLALLLIWKLLTTIHDRREFAKFEKERMRAKWDTGENPIYKGAVTTFKNPTYGNKQQ